MVACQSSQENMMLLEAVSRTKIGGKGTTSEGKKVELSLLTAWRRASDPRRSSKYVSVSCLALSHNQGQSALNMGQFPDLVKNDHLDGIH